MEALVPVFVAVVLIAGLLAVDLLAMRFGADSRPAIGDDHARTIGS